MADLRVQHHIARGRRPTQRNAVHQPLVADGTQTVGVSDSGHYVRTGESPTLANIETFLGNWL